MNYLFDIQLFPSVTYSKILFSETNILLEQYESYLKSGFANRYKVCGANGTILLSVPLLGGRDQKTLIKDLRIADHEPWQRQHLRTLTACYSRSPYFEEYLPSFGNFYEKRYEFLVDLQLETLEWLKKMLRSSANWELSTTYLKEMPADVTDLRHRFNEAVKTTEAYPQVFQDRIGFVPGLSVLDLLFNVGPASFYHISTKV